MSDDFVNKNPLLTLKYFTYLLQIQEGVENTRRFNILPMWKAKHGHATFDNKALLYLMRNHGDEEDRIIADNATYANFNKHSRLPEFWRKYFPVISKLERSNDNKEKKFSNMFHSDGVAVTFVFDVTYKNNNHDNPRVKTVPLRTPPCR